MSKEFTVNDVKEAGSLDKGLHIIIDNDVYKMDGFVEEHPGGAKILKRVGGKDASKQFWKVSGHRCMLYECVEICCTACGMVHCMGRPWTWTLGSLNGLPSEMLRTRMALLERTTANTYPQYHNESVLKKYQERLKVGTLKESAKL
jgi:hypothetical protein